MDMTMRFFAGVTPRVVDVSSGDVNLPLHRYSLGASGAGNIAVDTINGDSQTISVAAGAMIPAGGIKTVKQTGTTATGLTVYYWISNLNG